MRGKELISHVTGAFTYVLSFLHDSLMRYHPHLLIRKLKLRTSLVVQWLRLHALNEGGPGSTPDQGTRSHMPQLRIGILIPYDAIQVPACQSKDQTQPSE